MKIYKIIFFTFCILTTQTIVSQNTTKPTNTKSKSAPVSNVKVSSKKTAKKATSHKSTTKSVPKTKTTLVTPTKTESVKEVKVETSEPTYEVISTTKKEDNDKNSSKDFYHESYKTRNSGSFNKGRSLISLGYGLPNWLYSGYGAVGYLFYSNFKTHRFGPLMLKYEYGIMDEVGVSAMFQYATKSWTYGSAHTYKDKATGIGGTIMGNYHFNKFIPVKKMDVYASLGCSVTFETLTYDPLYYLYYYGSYYPTYQPANETNVVVRPIGIIGARYYLNKTFAGFLELGSTTLSSINAGITLNF